MSGLHRIERRGRRAVLVLVGVVLAGGAPLVQAGSAAVADAAAAGSITQLAGTQGCAADLTTTPGCTSAGAVDGLAGLVVSPDGRQAYGIAQDDDAIMTFDRDADTGALTPAGCLDGQSEHACGPVTAMGSPYAVAISPDGKNLYVPTFGDGAVVVLARNTSTGALTQLGGTAGCLASASGPLSGTCEPARGLKRASGIAVAADGLRVYATGYGDSAVAVFDRDASTGALTQAAGTAGCLAEAGSTGAGQGCGIARGLDRAQQVAVSPGGSSVYVAGGSGTVAAFTAGPGGLTQAAAPDGCLASVDAPIAGGSCGPVRGLGFVSAIVVSGDGRSVYAAGGDSGLVSTGNGEGVAVLTRDTVTGTLTQPAGSDGCLVAGGLEGCAELQAADDVYALAIAPDGATVYAGSYASSAVLVLDRDAATGLLTQPAGAAGCVAPVGSAAVAGGCAVGAGLAGTGYGPAALAVDPQGETLYAASYDADAVAVFRRTVPTADLAVTLAGLPDATTGSASVLTMTVRNNGPDQATTASVTVSATLPGTALSVDPADVPAGTTCTAGTSLTCTTAVLGSAASVQLPVRLTTSVEGLCQATATVTGARTDPDATGDMAVHVVVSRYPVLPIPVVPTPATPSAPTSGPTSLPTPPVGTLPTETVAAPASVSLATASGRTQVVAGRPVVLSGRVTDVRGRPLAYTPVLVLASDGRSGYRPLGTVFTDGEGRYSTRLVPRVQTRYGVVVRGSDGPVVPPRSVLIRVTPAR